MSESTHTPATLSATERDNTVNPRQLRSAGFVPATLYGKGVEPQSIQVRTVDFVRLYGKGIRTFKLTGLPGGDVVVKAHQVQLTAIKQDVLNIEFLVPNAEATAKPGKAAQKAEAEKPAPQEQETVLAGA